MIGSRKAEIELEASLFQSFIFYSLFVNETIALLHPINLWCKKQAKKHFMFFTKGTLKGTTQATGNVRLQNRVSFDFIFRDFRALCVPYDLTTLISVILHYPLHLHWERLAERTCRHRCLDGPVVATFSLILQSEGELHNGYEIQWPSALWWHNKIIIS